MQSSNVRPSVRRLDPMFCYIALATNVIVLASAFVERQLAPPPRPDIVISAASLTPAPDRSFGLSPRGARAFALLSAETMFVGARVDLAATPSTQAIAFRTLLREPDADVTFARLLGYSNAPAGRLYGLAGLYVTDPVAYRKARVIYIFDKTPLRSYSGSNVHVTTVWAMLQQIDNGVLPGELAGERPSSLLADSLDVRRRGETNDEPTPRSSSTDALLRDGTVNLDSPHRGHT